MLLNDKPNSSYTLENGLLFNKSYSIISIIKDISLNPFEITLNESVNFINDVLFNIFNRNKNP